jgi:type I restriction enzyme S subunit
MSKIDELIAELCPAGVARYSVGQLCKVETGKRDANEGNDYGQFHFFTTAKKTGRIETYRWDCDALLIAGNANIGNVKQYSGKFDAYQRTYVLTHFRQDVEVRYLYFALSDTLNFYLNANKNVAAMTYIVLKTLVDFEVPVPPLEVQREIVSILDKFTQLEAELEAELSARQRQFRYFCDLMFETVDSEQQFSSLGEMGSFHKGGNFQKSDFSESGEPCIHYGQIHTRLGTLTHTPPAHIPFEFGSKLPRANPGDLVIADTAEDLAGVAKATAWLGDSPISLGGHILVYKHHFDPAYISFFFQSSSFQAQKNMLAKGVKVKDISSTAIAKIKIPIHSLSRQKQISKGLSSLQVLLEGSVNSLPAEIAARRQQYEYYRDKLLTFKELDVA